MLSVTESGLYALAFKSRKPEAKAFRKWVTSEVLPAIRKQGRYESPNRDEPPGRTQQIRMVLMRTIQRVEQVPMATSEDSDAMSLAVIRLAREYRLNLKIDQPHFVKPGQSKELAQEAFWKQVLSGINQGSIHRENFKLRKMVRNEGGKFEACTGLEPYNDLKPVCCLNFQPIYMDYVRHLAQQRLTAEPMKRLKQSLFKHPWAWSKCERLPGEPNTIRVMAISLAEEDGFPFGVELRKALSKQDTLIPVETN